MEPKTISEKLMFNTIKLFTNSTSGTGFFYNFKIGNGICPTIITNKHVVNYNHSEYVTFCLHLKTGEYSSAENYKVTCAPNWIFHSSKDLCFCFINPIFEKVKQETNKEVFYTANDESITITKEKLENLSALEEIVMVGYPIGLLDKNNNYPIFRKGFTASHPATDFNEKGIGLVDMACFPGSSGSPIYILNENGYSDKNGNMYLGASRLIFLGILYAFPTYNANGEIVIKNIPTKQQILTRTTIPTNLGYYIKSTEL